MGLMVLYYFMFLLRFWYYIMHIITADSRIYPTPVSAPAPVLVAVYTSKERHSDYC